MNTETLKEIDFYRIRDEIAGFCLSEEGRNFLLLREPLQDSSETEFYKKCSREWLDFICLSSVTPFLPWNPIRSILALIRTEGASLSLEQVHSLGLFCLSLERVRTSIFSFSGKIDMAVLREQAELLPDMTGISGKIFRVITHDGELRELPEIAAIRGEISALNRKVVNIMRSYISDRKYSEILESDVPVYRNGRQLLAVRSDCQGRIPGIVHEISQTGRTVFIEPEEAVRCGNDIMRKEYELDVAVKKILSDLTASLRPSVREFLAAIPIMENFDATLAAAKWGRDHGCCYALECCDSSGNEWPPLLLAARHPLLGERAVPVDIRFMPGKRILIITGPNTGGKTVALKTFALFSAMNQAGFPVPAADGTRLPFFSDIFADIGDSQSLDQSLSTFGGHMRNIAAALDGADSGSLVLLDELGSGTDPLEGAAISMAVLDELIRRGPFVLVTTHQGVLKNYGYTGKACINASVEFNKDTLAPSYRLVMGVPGESHALDIAVKSGIPERICTAARSYISGGQTDVSALINGLNSKHSELDRLLQESADKSRMLDERELGLREKEFELRQKENELRQGIQREMQNYLSDSRSRLENLVRRIREGELTKDKTREVRAFSESLADDTEKFAGQTEAEARCLDEIAAELSAAKSRHEQKYGRSSGKTKKRMKNSEALRHAAPAIQRSAEKKNMPEPVFEAGVFVRSITSGSEGVIVSRQSSGVWLVQFGSIRMPVKERNLEVLRGRGAVMSPTVSVDMCPVSDSGKDTMPRPVFELRLLGMRSEEALRALERQVDLCNMQNFRHFSVIHGKGDGILQQAVQNYLSHCPGVQEFHYAPAEDGGAGKTYVTMS